MGASAVILGASGFSGGEVVRLLAGHPSIVIGALGARGAAGAAVASRLPHVGALGGDRFSSLAEAAATPADVCLACLPLGAASELIDSIAARTIVDLSGDHRFQPGWAFGLPEYRRKSISEASRIACPGCYPTASLLALLPYARAGVITGPVVIDAISGVTGAGRAPSDETTLAVADDNLRAYGTTDHRHVGEIEKGLSELGGLECQVSFTPHLAPLARGLVATCRARVTGALSTEDGLDLLKQAYSEEPFVDVLSEWPESKPTRGSNRARVSVRVDERTGWLIASAAIDNLGKGAAGQAIQNMNLALGFEETAGLQAIGVWP